MGAGSPRRDVGGEDSSAAFAAPLLYGWPGHLPLFAMRVAFVGLFCASLPHTDRRGELALYARKRGDTNANKSQKDASGISYCLPPYTYSQNPDDYAYLKEPGKIAAAMWRDYIDNSGQMDPKLNRPMRHYPAHHYKREIKQKIGLQRKEARLQILLREATTPRPEDDFMNLNPIHRPRILDAFDRLEAWKSEVSARLPQTEQRKTNAVTASIGVDDTQPGFSDTETAFSIDDEETAWESGDEDSMKYAGFADFDYNYADPYPLYDDTDGALPGNVDDKAEEAKHNYSDQNDLYDGGGYESSHLEDGGGISQNISHVEMDET
ncbi:DUF3575 domain-containing protein [Babesia caballi]|uniref:DUF3575 domain-containing protein n=1 Tax=Babesia caballi TaxID=5871 RepID=A0AAV4LYD5_BABCB|nr:DUF3575 domain-containing protein [Babesia caballi]